MSYTKLGVLHSGRRHHRSACDLPGKAALTAPPGVVTEPEAIPDGLVVLCDCGRAWVAWGFGWRRLHWWSLWRQRIEPVGAPDYPDPIPREDQDYDGARRPHGPRPGLLAQAVRPATETGDDA